MSRYGLVEDVKMVDLVVEKRTREIAHALWEATGVDDADKNWYTAKKIMRRGLDLTSYSNLTMVN